MMREPDPDAPDPDAHDVGQADPHAHIIARLDPSGPRRVFGVAVLGALGFVLITFALRNPGGAIGWSMFLLGVGLGAVYMGWRLWQATAQGLILTSDTLCATDGQVLARIADISAVDRGALAIKPAGGFTLRLRNPAHRTWEPGLWWRAGRKVGVGGVTRRHEARFMAEKIVTLIADSAPDA